MKIPRDINDSVFLNEKVRDERKEEKKKKDETGGREALICIIASVSSCLKIPSLLFFSVDRVSD